MRQHNYTSSTHGSTDRVGHLSRKLKHDWHGTKEAEANQEHPHCSGGYELGEHVAEYGYGKSHNLKDAQSCVYQLELAGLVQQNRRNDTPCNPANNGDDDEY